MHQEQIGSHITRGNKRKQDLAPKGKTMHLFIYVLCQAVHQKGKCPHPPGVLNGRAAQGLPFPALEGL